MPLPMVHLGVAYNLLQKHNLVDKPEQFYLGAIAPDAVHTREEGRADDKKISHLYICNAMNNGAQLYEISEDDIYKIKNDVLDFIVKFKHDKEFSLYFGYGIHILTDIYWTRGLYLQFQKNYSYDLNPLQDEKWAYFNDTDQLDFELFKICVWRNEVWKLLNKTQAIDVIDMVKANEIEDWKNRTLHWYDSGKSQHNNPIKYITVNDLLSCIDNATNDIFDFVKPAF